MKYTAFCNNSCCPSITIAEGNPLLIEDDYDGAISLTLAQFSSVTQWLKEYKDETIPKPVNCLYQLAGFELVAKLYVVGEERLINVHTREKFVQKITFEQWQVFVDLVNENAAVLA